MRADGRRPRRARGAEGAAAARRSARSSPARRRRPGVYLFRDARGSRCSTSAGRATCGRGFARTSRAGASGRRSRRRSGRSRTSSGARRARSSRRRSRSCGCSASCGRLRMRAARDRTARSYLRRRGAALVRRSRSRRRYGPIAGKTLARRAARALDGHDDDDPRCRPTGSARAAPPARARAALRGRRPAARPNRGARSRCVERLAELERLRALRACLLVPAREPGFVRAVLVAGGRIVAAPHRSARRGCGRSRSMRRSPRRRAAPSTRPSRKRRRSRVVASFLRRPPPELQRAAARA